MKRVFLFTALVAMIMLSCTRPRGKASACFNISKTPAKVNDTLYLLNCSLNYDKYKWTVTSMGIADSLNRHLKFVPTSAGNLDITLKVFDNDTTTTSTITQTITVQ
jgi:hypothetical protein